MKKKSKILFYVKNLSEELKKAAHYLEKESFDILPQCAISPGISHSNNTPNLVLIDLESVHENIEACYNLRDISALNTCIIVILASENDITSQIAAYNAGADDYIIKPINPRILAHKIISFDRRLKHIIHHPTPLSAGDIQINREQYHITLKDGPEIELPKKEFELLSLLMSFPKKVFTRQEILEKIWQTSNENKSRTIDVHIRRLRKTIGSKYFKTVKGIGYSFQV